MPIEGRKPHFYRFRRYLPQNRVQQQRIRVPENLYRPIRLKRRDVVIRGRLVLPHEWFTLHRRFFPGEHVQIPGDDRERRAIPEFVVKGTLPERIFYLELIKRNYVPELDFSFQSAAEGGRTELGGLVVDFLFEDKKLVVQIDGPTHARALRMAKDEEQEDVLASMGFSVLRIKEDEVYDAHFMEQWFRENLDWGVVSILNPFDTYTEDVVAYDVRFG